MPAQSGASPTTRTKRSPRPDQLLRYYPRDFRNRLRPSGQPRPSWVLAEGWGGVRVLEEEMR
jgi:hypothetical protein